MANANLSKILLNISRQRDRAVGGEPVPGPGIGTVHGDIDARPEDGESSSSTTAANEEK